LCHLRVGILISDLSLSNISFLIDCICTGWLFAL
jgi:hypothetical protein